MSSTLTPLERSIAARLVQAAGAQPAAAALWLFGSRARGASHKNSDLDLAVAFSTAESPAHRLWLDQVRESLEAPIAERWPGFVNLVDRYADDADPRLARRVRSEGIALWQRPSSIGPPDATAAPRR
jgi:predicted nucleotidyltransferase